MVARASVSNTVALQASDLIGVAALWSFFLLLRVFDEHKDFGADSIAHPDRVLQRGLVTLKHLRVLGAGAVALQLAASMWFDGGLGPVTAWWSAALGWSLLMEREFWMSRWLRGHLMVYALSHMAVMLLIVGWVASMGASAATHQPMIWALGGLVFLAGLVFEIARKIRAPEDERPMADSYTRALGIPRASGLLALLTVVTGIAASAIAQRLGSSGALTGSIVTGVLSLLVVLAATRFALRPTRRGASIAEAAAGISIMAAHVMVVIAVVSTRTVVWR
jgi:4-hydroxybenzoate polyprenyltransferase